MDEDPNADLSCELPVSNLGPSSAKASARDAEVQDDEGPVSHR